MARFDGKVVLVTGGSRGIGRACCLKFAQLGAKVGVNYASNQAAANQVVQTIQDEGGQAIVIQANVANSQEVAAMVRQLVDAFGQIDILVNNAGTTIRHPVMEMPEEAWRHVIDVNLTGAFLCTKEVVKHMMPRRSGVIVNIASMAGKTGATDCAYVASKGGLIAVSKSIARDVAPYNIRVNVLNPGLIATEMVEGMNPERKKMLLGGTLMGRMGRPEEIANVVAFLASDEASYMTATVVDVNGGRLVG